MNTSMRTDRDVSDTEHITTGKPTTLTNHIRRATGECNNIAQYVLNELDMAQTDEPMAWYRQRSGICNAFWVGALLGVAEGARACQLCNGRH